MSAASCVLSEDQFLCCICLDVFTNPVTIPCGHNFCKKCITQHWTVNSPQCRCPMCKKQFLTRPELHLNTFISEMAAEFRLSAGKKKHSDSEVKAARPGEVCCDVCTGTKMKAVKSCLTCFTSYCGIHIDPHLTADSLMRHVLSDPVKDMESRVCSKHKKSLELYCSTDQMCVCAHCMVSEHNGHKLSSLRDEVEEKKVLLEQTEAEVQQMIKERRLMIGRMDRLKTYSKDDAEREIADGVRIFTHVMQTAERQLNLLIEMIEEKHKTLEREVDVVIKDLEQEISSLMEKTKEMEQTSRSLDYVLILQTFSSVNSVPNTNNWDKVRVCLPSYKGSVEKATAELEEIFVKEKEQQTLKAELKKYQQYVVDVTLDPQTANPWLDVSEDNKQVRCEEVRKELPDNPNRFSLYANVVAQQSISSGRFYYEVQVSGKTDWTLGVVKESVDRKGIIPLSPQHGYWSVGLRNGSEILSLSSPVVSINTAFRPKRVGVFVSYEEGLVSFYDVDALAPLYSFTNCSFTEELRPFFSPGLHHGGANSAPLVIVPVNDTEFDFS